jgi:hypothetical protein
MEPEDEPFVVSGWSSSYRKSRDSTIPMPLWASTYHPIVRWYMARPTAKVIVAHGEVLRGFICYEPGYVLYIYVGKLYRRYGIARGLFCAAGINPDAAFTYACRTWWSWRLMEQCGKAPHARFDPYPARYLEKENEDGPQDQA